MSEGPASPEPRRARRRALDPRTDKLLRTLLEGSEPLLPFAEAVAVHLTADPAAASDGDAMLGQLARILRAAQDPGEEPPVDLLVANPVLLASLFQNTDLLDPQLEETALIARMVMAALERMDDVSR